MMETEFYEEARKYFENKYSNDEWSVKPNVDHDTRENTTGELLSNLDIKDEVMDSVERIFKISRNEFFITAAILAISIYNKKDNIKISWIYNGREDVNSMNTVGLLFRDLPVALKLDVKRTLRDLFQDVHKQVQDAIKYSCYSYVDTTYNVVSDDAAYLLYQQDIRDTGSFGDMSMETIDIRQNQAASQTVLDIQILDGEAGLQTILDYASSRYDDANMVKFKDLFIRVVHAMVKDISQNDVTVGEIKKEVNSGNSMIKKIVSIFKRKA